MIRKITLILFSALFVFEAQAQFKNLDYKFYGFVRGDFFMNSRVNNTEVLEGALFLYPSEKVEDVVTGSDINESQNSGFYLMSSRLGLDVSGSEFLGAKTFAKIETDFGGFGGSHTMLRLRHVYAQLKWEKYSTLLLGQTWHPFSGDIRPSVLTLSLGAPFQPLCRTPQIRYTHSFGKLSLSAVVLYQYQYMSSGPEGKSTKYSRHAKLPELLASIDYKDENLTLTAAVDYLTIAPTLSSKANAVTPDGVPVVVKNKTSVSSLSYMLAGQYDKNLLSLRGKTILGKNLSHINTLGGYGVDKMGVVYQNPDGSNRLEAPVSYTPFLYSTSWMSVAYGKKYLGALFLGYSQQLGADGDKLVRNAYGMGTNIDRLIGLSAQFSYNVPRWSLGLEYYPCRAYYGDLNEKGKIVNKYNVTNHRLLAVVTHSF